MKLFGNIFYATVELKKIETCGLIKGLDFIYHIILCLSILLLFLYKTSSNKVFMIFAGSKDVVPFSSLCSIEQC